MKSFQIVLNDPQAPEDHHKSIYVTVASPYYPEIEPILKRLNELTLQPAEWKLHSTFVDGKEVTAANENGSTPSFESVTRPVIKWLNDNCHPHIKVIVHTTGAERVEGVESTGEIMDYVKD